jgi:hypothetical protein
MHLWIALDDVTSDNSGMIFYKGSHRFGLAPHIYETDGLPRVQPALLERLSHMRIEPEMPAGSAALFDGRTIHGSKANVTDKMRLALVVAVRGADTSISNDLEIFASVITRFFREEIGIEKCSQDDDFFTLSGDESVADRVRKRITGHFGVEITAPMLAELRTPAALAQEVIRLTGWRDLNT